MVRKPVVSGMFYPANPKDLTSIIDSFLKNKSFKKENKARGLVLPHAGYIYSGQVAAQTIASFELADLIVVLGTKHTLSGKDFSLSSADAWQTPLGQIETDKEFSSLLLSKSKYIKKDDEAHKEEHSIEVQLPLLQHAKKDFKIVPIVISFARVKNYEDIGSELVACAKELNREVTIIASTDLTHYEPQELAQKKDKTAIEAILELNSSKLIENLQKLDISMCGFAPTCVTIEAMKKIGAKSTKLIKYQTSGDVTRDYSSVVGYAGIGIY